MYNLRIIFIALLSLFLISCEKKETSGPIKIAAIEPLSGPYAAVGKDLIDGIVFSSLTPVPQIVEPQKKKYLGAFLLILSGFDDNLIPFTIFIVSPE